MSGSPAVSRKQVLLGAVAATVVVVAVGTLLSGRGVDRDREAARLHEDCGVALADLVDRVLPRGGTVLVLEHDGSGLPADKQEWMRGQIRAFHDALPGGVDLVQQQAGSEAAAGVSAHSGRAADPRLVRHEAFAALAPEALDGVDLLVSFMGEPLVGEGGAARWKELPPVVCFSLTGDDVPALMREGVVAAAIVPRVSPLPIKEYRKRSWFESMYEVVTPETLDTLDFGEDEE